MESRHDSENADRVLRIMAHTTGGAKHLINAIAQAHIMSSCQAFEVARIRQQLLSGFGSTTRSSTVHRTHMGSLEGNSDGSTSDNERQQIGVGLFGRLANLANKCIKWWQTPQKARPEICLPSDAGDRSSTTEQMMPTTDANAENGNNNSSNARTMVDPKEVSEK